MRSRWTLCGTTAATRPASCWPTSPSRSSATIYGRRSRSVWLVAADQLLQPLPLGLALLQRRAHFAQLDRAGDDAGVERGIVGPQLLDRAGTRDTPCNAGGEHFEMEGFGD